MALISVQGARDLYQKALHSYYPMSLPKIVEVDSAGMHIAFPNGRNACRWSWYDASIGRPPDPERDKL